MRRRLHVPQIVRYQSPLVFVRTIPYFKYGQTTTTTKRREELRPLEPILRTLLLRRTILMNSILMRRSCTMPHEGTARRVHRTLGSSPYTL